MEKSAVVPLSQVSLKCRNFKCFADTPQGFDTIKPMNIIIGRNNSGKTTLLDLIEHTVDFTDISRRGHKGGTPEGLISFSLSEQFLTQHLPNSANDDHGTFHLNLWAAKHLTGKRLICRIPAKGNISLHDVDGYSTTHPVDQPRFKIAKNAIQKILVNPFQEIIVRRIVADRDIVMESSNSSDTPSSISIDSNGRHVTRIIERFLNAEGPEFPRDQVEIHFLNDLNRLLRPDAEYTRIDVVQHTAGNWEVQLEEEGKGFVPLSQTGSGLKTILLVLTNLLLVPCLGDQPPLSQFFFAFEELENNLHPAVQRRLFHYLAEMAKSTGCHFFITTHSNVVIDQFSGDENAQLLHVEHDGEVSTVNTVTTFNQSQRILDDLDVRASDLLQTNVVVWVEGPSDRLYFNKWIEIWSEGRIVEGIHYQCLPVGGSQNAHFSFEEPDVVNDLIAALKINRNAILIADSDRREENDELKVHTKRLADEVSAGDGYSWITKGREVENYIPPKVFQEMFNNEALKGPGEYSDVFEYVADKKSTGKPRKMILAREVVELLDKDSINQTLDLHDRLDDVCKHIRVWNRLDA